ncbi:hypothetical protein RIF29_24850 [Crotalaria pallida]|uniref:Uncharacterized protein n=1 Tax=Crotalaria pallida TaxID=3830 RepID=A0AAN9ESQ6_CROPI
MGIDLWDLMDRITLEDPERFLRRMVISSVGYHLCLDYVMHFLKLLRWRRWVAWVARRKWNRKLIWAVIGAALYHTWQEQKARTFNNISSSPYHRFCLIKREIAK